MKIFNFQFPTAVGGAPQNAVAIFNKHLRVGIFLLFFFFALPAFAQVDTGLNPLTATGLGTADIRVTIANGIRIFLGLLGIIAIAIILAGGLLWMTAGGNEEKVQKAKTLLLQAVIGLGIVLAAFTITTFILNRILDATGASGGTVTEPGTGGTGGSGGSLPRDAFTVRSIQPQGTQTIRNLSVRLFFTKAVDSATVSGNVAIIKVSDGSAVAGAFTTDGAVVTFTPDAACSAPNTDRKCFEATTEYRVEATARAVKSSDGKELLCGIGGLCRVTFTSGTRVDTAPPTVRVIEPLDGGFVSTDALVPIDFTAEDDAGIASASIAVDGQNIATIAPPATTPQSWTSGVNWDTTGKVPGTSYTIRASTRDVDSNQADSATITVRLRAAHCFNRAKDADETAIDCGGNDCGVCAGGSCQSNDQCASGACSGGKCVEFPTITRVTPADGAPGNLITILGRGFGATKGTGSVTFLGGSGDADNKEATAPQSCSATGLWRDDRIIVAIPAGAVTGGIKVTNDTQFYDDTENSRGVKYTFTPSDITRPGLCSMTPEEGAFGVTFAVSGVNFGTTRGTMTIGGSSAGNVTWGDTTIRGAVVPNLAAGTADVIVAQGSALSNPLPFRVKELFGAPRLLAVDPIDGPPGTYMTLRGNNFGTTGTVRFVNKTSGVETVADTSFPEGCAATTWTSSAVTVKTPGVAEGGYDVRVVTTNDLASNSMPFTVNQRSAAPGICRLNPDNGPAGLSVVATGERFGTTQGKLVFFNEKNAFVKTWTAQSVEAQVPLGATTGALRLVDGRQTRSNTLPFTVRDCRSGASCESGNECCSDGACRERGTCKEGAAACTYGWKFTTGAGGGGGVDDPCVKNADCAQGLSCDLVTKTCQATIPQVVEEETCTANTQSPSPYRDNPNACTNAQIAVRFTMDMHDASLQNVGNVVLVKCNTGERLKQSDCTGTISTQFSEWIAHDTKGEGVVYKPTTALSGNTWYRVTLNGSKGNSTIMSRDAVLLDGDRDGKPGGDYQWFFHTTTGSCAVDHVQVTPRQATITDPNNHQDFTGMPTGPHCNILDPNGQVWQWSSLDTTKASVLPAGPGARTTAEPKSETGTSSVKIKGAVGAKEDTGDLTIIYPAPSVVEQWPDCDAACSNAEVGAVFSSAIDAASLGGDAVQLFACQPDKCTGDGLTLVSAVTRYNSTTRTVTIIPQASLRPDTVWRVVLASTIRGVNRKALTGLNFDAKAPAGDDAYSWTFRTKGGVSTCAIASTTVEPDALTAYVVGQSHQYTSVPHGAPDACNEVGQRLVALPYQWQWTSAAPLLARVTNQDILPQGASDGNVDPEQRVTGLGQQRATAIAAAAEGKSGSGAFSLVCGFTDDRQCPRDLCPLVGGGPYACGVGGDTCCSRRPSIVRVTPASGMTNVCRNAAIEVEFDDSMNEASFAGNVLLSKSATACASFDTCATAVRGTTEVKNVGGHTILSFIPSAPLDGNTTTYVLQLRGDTFGLPAQAASQKIRNAKGVALAGTGAYTFSTKAGTDMCLIESVEIKVGRDTAAPVPAFDDLFTCAGRDDCNEGGDDDAVAAQAGNQHHYFARALDDSRQPLIAEYEWQPVVGEPIVTLTAAKELATITAAPQNGSAEVTVLARGRTKEEGSAAATIAVTTFICENPWPSLAQFPWTDTNTSTNAAVDNNTHFSLFYCRDAGKPGYADDLPALKNPVTVPQPASSDVVKDLLLPVKNP